MYVQQLQALGLTHVYMSPDALSSIGNRQRALDAQFEAIRDCQRCRLCEKRTQVVFGVGNPDADLVFVGEGPGADEDEQGIPFVGKAGQLLTRMIQAMGLSRDDVYICNVVKCRPPDNRDPKADEVASCEPFLKQQLATVQPKVIVGLGGVACKTLLKTRTGIMKLRGKWQSYEGIPLMPTFHPSYLLHKEGEPNFKEEKRKAWDDLQQVMTRLGLKRPAG